MYRNLNSCVAPRDLKCSVRYFDRICENPDTLPVFLKHLINNLSRFFYARENKLGHFHLRHNLSDAYYLAKVLCMLKHQLIVNRLFSQLNILFDLASNLFCDIVLFTDISCSSFQKYMQKHNRIIKTFYSLHNSLSFHSCPCKMG